MNVWRWAPFMLAQGGSWTDKNNQPAFNSPAAVKATQLYAELFKYAPPGAATDWSNALEAFRSGKVAFMIESTPFADWMEDSSKVQRGRQGRLCPSAGTPALGRLWPRPGHLGRGRQGRMHAPGGRQVHRLRHRQGTGTGRLREKVFSDYNRNSTIQSDYFQKNVKPQILAGLKDTTPVSKLTIWPSPQWPDIGDNLGVALEEVFTGTQKDIPRALNDAAQYAQDAMEHAQ
jgi:multiple sugar transport system substrate-binding protein